MSRSYRKRPYIGRNSRCSDKEFKREYNRRMRSNVNTMIKTYHPEELDDVIFPERHIEYSDVWNSKSDGPKQYIGQFNSARQQCYLWYICVGRDVFHITSFDEMEIAEKQFNLTEYEWVSMFDNIGYNQSYYLYRNFVFELAYTQEEKIEKNKKHFAKWMRK